MSPKARFSPEAMAKLLDDVKPLPAGDPTCRDVWGNIEIEEDLGSPLAFDSEEIEAAEQGLATVTAFADQIIVSMCEAISWCQLNSLLSAARVPSTDVGD